MTKQTKLELVQINARLASENEALRKQVADLTLQAALLQRQVGGLKDLVEIHKEHAATPAPAPKRPMPQWQQDRAAAMAAARALAMSTGNVVRA